MPLREPASDVGVELLELGVHAVGTEALAQLDHGGRAAVVEQLVDHHDVPGHGCEANPGVVTMPGFELLGEERFMGDAVIVSACRTAIGTARKGTLLDVSAFDLAKYAVVEALKRSGVPAADV